ncbi:MAG: hypothetical protein IT279_04540 [Ignavibacteriaceae bacterium]|nr:hypothetical protein [Ignavibacteriaceae bacterium]
MTKVLICLFLFVTVSNLFPQKENHKWKPLIITESQKVWVDQSQADTITAPVFDIWVLELHQPLLTVEGIKGKVMRSKSLYQVNVLEKCYNLKSVVYYNSSNTEIARFDYDLSLMNENNRFSFPVYEESVIDKIIRTIFIRTAEY